MKNDRFDEKMLILIVSYVHESQDYILDVENLLIIDCKTGKALSIKRLIKEITQKKRYIEGMVKQAWEN